MVLRNESVGPNRRIGARSVSRRDVAGFHQRVVGARVATVEDRCWQCRSKVRAIVGVILDPEVAPEGGAFLPFDEVVPQLAAAVDHRALATRRIGALRHRDSPGVAGGYLSNGCIECDALIGRFRLEDLLHEHLAGGGTYAQLDIGIPLELEFVRDAPAALRAVG